MKITKKSYETIIDTMNEMDVVKELNEKLKDRDKANSILTDQLKKSLEGKLTIQ